MILLVYHAPIRQDASTIDEHISAFVKYSSNHVVMINTALGYPKELKDINVSVIVLHYSIFGYFPFGLSDTFKSYIASVKVPKIVFLQDEYYYFRERLKAINELGIEYIYSLFNPEHFKQVYYDNCSVKKVQHTLTGYVDDNLIDNASKYSLPFTEREYDVGYRARQLPYYMGAGAQEKTNIAYTFEKNVKNKGLKLSITPKEEDRLYGEHWHHFVGNCRFMLGVEAGVSIVDLEGVVVNMVNDYLTKYPDASFDEVEKSVLSPYENNIFYRRLNYMRMLGILLQT